MTLMTLEASRLFSLDKRSPVPLYHQLRTALEQEILSGRWAPGDMLPTEMELCEQLGVSRATVRHAILDLVRQGLLVRLPARGTFVAERRHHTRNTIVIATFSVPQAPVRAAEIFFRIWDGIQDAAEKRGFQVAIRKLDETSDTAAELIDRLRDDPITLGIAIFTWNLVAWEHVRRLHHAGFPYVLLNRYIPGREVPAVTLDDRGAVFDAVRYLHELGHRRIAFLQLRRDGASTSHDDRLRGYLEGMDAFGLQGAKRVVPLIGRELSSAEAIAQALAGPERPTALIVPNGYQAAEYATEAEILGIRVPDDLSIIGFEDSARVTERRPRITTIDYAPAAIGERAVELIHRQAAGDLSVRTRHMIRTSLILRDSCAPVNPALSASAAISARDAGDEGR